MRLFISFVCAFVLSAFLPGSSAWAAGAPELEAWKQQGDSAYLQKNYPQAVAAYQQYLKHNARNAAVYYNLGNCYYRLQDYPRAVLNYERTLRFSPGDADARFNLQLVRTKLEDQFGTKNEMFFVRWMDAWMNLHGADGWAKWGIGLFVATLALFLGYLFLRPVLWCKLTFFSSLVLFAFVVLANVFAAVQSARTEEPGRAVVMRAQPMRPSPSASARKVVDLHQGTAVDVEDTSVKGWVQVALSDGRVGWVEAAGLEFV